MTFLTVILVVLLIYFALRFTLRLSAPYIMRYLSRKAGEKFENVFREMQQPGQNKESKEGTTTIHHIPKQPKKNESVGEYIDYEEIE